VINKQQLNRIGEFFSQDYTWHQMDGKVTRSSQDSSHVAMLRFIFKAIPDIQYTIDISYLLYPMKCQHCTWQPVINVPAMVCSNAGYYDYQHLVRDFKEFTLMTPAAFYLLDINAPEHKFRHKET
jgi:hypothetical protein